MLQRNQPAGIHSETALWKYLLLRGFWFYHWLRSCVWNLQCNLFPVPLWFGFLYMFLLMLSQLSDLLHYSLWSDSYFVWVEWVFEYLFIYFTIVSSFQSNLMSICMLVWNSVLALPWIKKVVASKILALQCLQELLMYYVLMYLIYYLFRVEGSFQQCFMCHVQISCLQGKAGGADGF